MSQNIKYYWKLYLGGVLFILFILWGMTYLDAKLAEARAEYKRGYLEDIRHITLKDWQIDELELIIIEDQVITWKEQALLDTVKRNQGTK